jgi:hypothetical protein
MIHNFNDIENNCDEVGKFLLKLKENGYIKKIGVSIYEPYQLEFLVKYFDFSGIYLTAPEPEEILRRIKMKKRWGEGDNLHKMEVKFFIECFDNNFKKDAKRHGYKCFSNSIKAEKEILDILSFYQLK